MSMADLTSSEKCVVLNLLKFHSSGVDLTGHSTNLACCIDPQTPEMLESRLGQNIKLVEENKTKL